MLVYLAIILVILDELNYQSAVCQAEELGVLGSRHGVPPVSCESIELQRSFAGTHNLLGSVLPLVLLHGHGRRSGRSRSIFHKLQATDPECLVMFGIGSRYRHVDGGFKAIALSR